MDEKVMINKEQMFATMKELNAMTEVNPQEKRMAEALFKNSQQVGNKVFLEIPVSLLKVDHEMYQRPLQKHVRQIAKKWEDDKCDPLMVNYRPDGFFYVIDGQHRLEAALMRSIESLVCIVFVGLTVKQEADIFTEQNEDTKKLTPYDTYKANLCRGEEIDTQIAQVCAKYGIRVEKSAALRTLKSVTAARKIIKTNGKNRLDCMFNFFNKTSWCNFKETYSSAILLGIDTLITNHEDKLTHTLEVLGETFKNSTPKEIQSIGNALYPQYPEKARLTMVLEELVTGDKNSPVIVHMKEKLAAA